MTCRILPFALTACLSASAVLLASPQELLQVESVERGDVVVVGTLGPVRLIGMEIPQAWAREAHAFMAGLLLDRSVRIEYDAIRNDAEGRVRGYLYLEDGRLANREIVRLGYAHAYLEYPFKERESFLAAAIEARDKNLGVWSRGIPGLATITPRAPGSAPASARPATSTPARPAASRVAPAAPPAAPQARAQCAATTQRGARCSRLAQPGRAFCWQH